VNRTSKCIYVQPGPLKESLSEGANNFSGLFSERGSFTLQRVFKGEKFVLRLRNTGDYKVFFRDWRLS